ncbi:MAG: YabP/YqfC family sporulation protein [Bacilli bacterium]
MFNKIKNYCLNPVFSFTYFNKKLNIINYKEIVVLESKHISFKFEGGSITVKGSDLTVKRLLDQEVLIGGNITLIELGEYHGE